MKRWPIRAAALAAALFLCAATGEAQSANPVRDVYLNGVSYVGGTIAYNSADASAHPLAARIPAGAMIVSVHVKVATAFNAGTSNTLTIGTNATSYNDLVAAGDVNATAVGTTSATRGVGTIVSSDTQVYVKYAQSGTAATAGSATVVIGYVNTNHM
jgi:hypothetical protein